MEQPPRPTDGDTNSTSVTFSRSARPGHLVKLTYIDGYCAWVHYLRQMTKADAQHHDLRKMTSLGIASQAEPSLQGHGCGGVHVCSLTAPGKGRKTCRTGAVTGLRADPYSPMTTEARRVGVDQQGQGRGKPGFQMRVEIENGESALLIQDCLPGGIGVLDARTDHTNKTSLGQK